MATVSERRFAYQQCMERGHQDSGITLTSNPPWSVCKWCGTHYRYEQHLVEANVPTEED
jgi:hypothetical protein